MGLLFILWEFMLCGSTLALAFLMWALPGNWKLIPACIWFLPIILPYREFPVLTSILEWASKHYNCVLKTTSSLPSSSFLLGIHPHGYASYSILYHLLHPSLRNVRLAQSGMGSFFPTPGLAAMLKGTMLVADRADMIAALNDGVPIAILPGGVKEMSLCEPGQPVTHLVRSHVGFLRIAHETDVPVVPSYVFGINNDYEPLLRIFLLPLRLFSAPFPAFWPSRHRSTINAMVTGQPLRSKDFSSFEAFVDAYFAQVESIFNQHKKEFGEGDCALKWTGSSSSSHSSSSRHKSSGGGFSLKPQEIVTICFVGFSLVARLLHSKWWGFSRAGWINENLSPWVAVHVASSSLWLVLANAQLFLKKGSTLAHALRGSIATLALLTSVFSASTLVLLELLLNPSNPHLWISAVMNMTFGGIATIYVVNAVATILSGTKQQEASTSNGQVQKQPAAAQSDRAKHVFGVKIAYNLLFVGLAPRAFVSVAALFGCDAESSLTASFVLFFLLQNSRIMHSYTFHRTLPFSLLSTLLATVVSLGGVIAWLSLSSSSSSLEAAIAASSPHIVAITAGASYQVATVTLGLPRAWLWIDSLNIGRYLFPSAGAAVHAAKSA